MTRTRVIATAALLLLCVAVGSSNPRKSHHVQVQLRKEKRPQQQYHHEQQQPRDNNEDPTLLLCGTALQKAKEQTIWLRRYSAYCGEKNSWSTTAQDKEVQLDDSNNDEEEKGSKLSSNSFNATYLNVSETLACPPAAVAFRVPSSVVHSGEHPQEQLQLHEKDKEKGNGDDHNDDGVILVTQEQDALLQQYSRDKVHPLLRSSRIENFHLRRKEGCARCGSIVFVHVPKTAGTTIRNVALLLQVRSNTACATELTI